MRIAKPLLMISLSVFLLAVSWSLLTGQLGLPGPAHAQTTEVYPGPPIQYFTITADSGLRYHIVDQEGYWWTRTTSAGWSRSFQLLAPGTPIPTGSESMGSFKSLHRGGN